MFIVLLCLFNSSAAELLTCNHTWKMLLFVNKIKQYHWTYCTVESTRQISAKRTVERSNFCPLSKKNKLDLSKVLNVVARNDVPLEVNRPGFELTMYIHYS